MPRRPSHTPLGEWLERVCRERGLSPTGLAERMGVSPTTTLAIIAGRPVSLEMVSKLAEMAHVPREQLIRLAGDQISYRGKAIPVDSAALRLGEIALLDSDEAVLARSPFWVARLIEQLRGLGVSADDFDGAATIFRAHARRMRERAAAVS